MRLDGSNLILVLAYIGEPYRAQVLHGNAEGRLFKFLIIHQMPLTSTQAAYIAGFVDGDGSVMAYIIKRPDYGIIKYQIRVSVNFVQRKDRGHFLKKIQEELSNKGSFRIDRGDGIADLALVGQSDLMSFLPEIRPYLRIKQKQANLVLRIIQELSQAKKDPLRFLELCKLVDQVTLLNASPGTSPKSQHALLRQEFIDLELVEN